DPTSAPASATALVDLKLTGSQFVTDAMVGFGDQSVKPTSATATEITVRIPAALLANAGTLPIKVQNPPTKGGASNALSFTVSSATTTLTLTAVSPAAAEQGTSRTLSLSVSGTGFSKSSRVRFNGTDLKTTFKSASELNASLPGSLLRLSGSLAVTVFDPQG